MLTTRATAEQFARTALRERLAAWGFPRDRQSAAYEDEVVATVLVALDGGDEPHGVAEHFPSDIGMCVDCDAAAVLTLLQDYDVELLGAALRETR